MDSISNHMQRCITRKTRTLNVAMDDETKKHVMKASRKLGMSMSEYVRLCIAYYRDAIRDR